MYGKKRVVINRRNRIIVRGERSNFNVGILEYLNGMFKATYLKKQNRFEHTISEDNSIVLMANSKEEIRDAIKKEYNIE